jgi:hypothetical protein
MNLGEAKRPPRLFAFEVVSADFHHPATSLQSSGRTPAFDAQVPISHSFPLSARARNALGTYVAPLGLTQLEVRS